MQDQLLSQSGRGWSGERLPLRTDFGISDSTRFIARRCVFLALKGRHRIAQGNAMGMDVISVNPP
jgi:hypothetical protein